MHFGQRNFSTFYQPSAATRQRPSSRALTMGSGGGGGGSTAQVAKVEAADVGNDEYDGAAGDNN